MVKGVAKRAVVVKNPGVSGFSEAIFIQNGESEDISINSASELLDAANRIAAFKPPAQKNTAGYVLCFLLGVTSSVILWLILNLVL